MERKATDQRRVWRLEAGLPEPTGTGPATRQLRPAGTGSGRLHRRHCDRPRRRARIAEAIVRSAATGLARLGDPEPPAEAEPTRRSMAMQAREGAINAIASGWR